MRILFSTGQQLPCRSPQVRGLGDVKVVAQWQRPFTRGQFTAVTSSQACHFSDESVTLAKRFTASDLASGHFVSSVVV